MENIPAADVPGACPGEIISGNPGWYEPPSVAGEQFTLDLMEFLQSSGLKIQMNICSHIFGNMLLHA